MTQKCEHKNAKLVEGWQYSLWDTGPNAQPEQTIPSLIWVMVDCPECGFHKTYYRAQMPQWLRFLRMQRAMDCLGEGLR